MHEIKRTELICIANGSNRFYTVIIVRYTVREIIPNYGTFWKDLYVISTIYGAIGATGRAGKTSRYFLESKAEY